MTIFLGSAQGASSSAALGGELGTQPWAPLPQLHLLEHRLSRVPLGDEPDTLLRPDTTSRERLWAQGCVDMANQINNTDPTAGRVALTGGRWSAFGLRPGVVLDGTSYKALTIPTRGLFDKSGWCFEFDVTPPAADLTTFTGKYLWWFPIGRYTRVYCFVASSTTVQLVIAYDNRFTGPSGSLGTTITMTATLTIAAGDFPADTALPMIANWWASTGTLELRGQANGGTIKTSTLTGGVVNPTWLRSPGDEPRVTKSGFVPGCDRVSGTGSAVGLHTSGFHFRRWPRRPGNTDDVTGDGIVIDPRVAPGGGALVNGSHNDKLAGIIAVRHTGANNDTPGEDTPYAAVRDLQIGTVLKDGCTFTRVAEMSRRVTVTVNADGTFASLDCTNLWAWLDLFAPPGTPYSRSDGLGFLQAVFMVGYVPAGLGGGANGVVMPNKSGVTQAVSFQAFADYYANLWTQIKARYGSSIVAGATPGAGWCSDFTFWNEPAVSGSWKNTSNQQGSTSSFAALHRAVRNTMASVHPDLPKIGSTDAHFDSPAYVAATTTEPATAGDDGYQWAILDDCASQSYALPHLVMHQYGPFDEAALADDRDIAQRALAAKSLPANAINVSVGEYGFHDTTFMGGAWPGLSNEKPARHLSAWAAAHLERYMTQTLKEGRRYNAFFRLGRRAVAFASATADKEDVHGLFDVNGRPLPPYVAFVHKWKHKRADAVIKVTTTGDRYSGYGTVSADRKRLTFTFSRVTPWAPEKIEAVPLDWSALGAAITAGTYSATGTWVGSRMDYRDHDIGGGRPRVVSGGDLTSLPQAVDMTGTGTYCIEITFA